MSERQGEVGLEIPIDIMAGISGARHAVEFKGGVVLKGVPIERQENRVQWHLIPSPRRETRLSYQDSLRRCQNRTTSDEVSPDRLRTARAIAGWCSVPGSLLGSEIANHENIDYSEAEDAGAPLKFAGGAIGF